MAKFTTFKRAYTQIDNALIYKDDVMSWEAIGIYSYCLAREDSWQMGPNELWGKRKLSRDRAYRALNEMIEAGYVLRLYARRGSGSKNLPGDVSYFVFDTMEGCRQKALEIAELDDETVYLDCSSKFKIESKKLAKSRVKRSNSEVTRKPQNSKKSPLTSGFPQLPEIQDAEVQDAETQEVIYKYSANAVLSKETTTAPQPERVDAPHAETADAVVVFSSLEELAIAPKVKRELCSNHSEEQIDAAVQALHASKTKVRSVPAFIRSALKGQYTVVSETSDKDRLVKELQELYSQTSPKTYRFNLEIIPTGTMEIYEKAKIKELVGFSYKVRKCIISLKSASEQELQTYLDLAREVKQQIKSKLTGAT